MDNGADGKTASKRRPFWYTVRMVVTYHGGECFKISQGDLTLAFNPPAKDSKLKVSKFGADVAFSTFDHEDFNGIDTASIAGKEPFVIDGPGEYEVKGVAVRGFGTEASYGGTTSINTVYSVRLENMNLCFLGALSGELPASAKQDLDDIDILFVPVGGEGTLGASDAEALAVKLEPRAVIPMSYDEKSLKAFLKEAGAEGTKPQDRLTVKKKDLDGKEAEIIVLSA